MSTITSGLTMTDIFSSMTGFFSTIAPYMEFLAGLLLVFFVIDYIVSTLSKKKE